MESLYQTNGLIFWTQKEILFRDQCVQILSQELSETLKTVNPAWEFERVEAPLLTPRSYVSANYTGEDIWEFEADGVCLRPETTPGSYAAARHLLNPHRSRKYRLPLCVWQHGKSFRREQDQVTKNMRLKEFYQLEFQCLYGLTTGADYLTPVVETIRATISRLLSKPCIVEASDRLPEYSESTTDIICEGMEVCSISVRKDYEGAKVLEVAVGTDRLVYQRFHAHLEVFPEPTPENVVTESALDPELGIKVIAQRLAGKDRPGIYQEPCPRCKTVCNVQTSGSFDRTAPHTIYCVCGYKGPSARGK